MTTAKFLEGFSGNLAEQWVTTLFTPAFVFWLGGGLAALQRWGWDAFADFFGNLEEPLPIVIGVLGLLGVAASGFVVKQFDFTVLRLLEGYWPRWCHPLARRLVQGQRRRLKQLDQQLQGFNRKGLAKLTPEERQAYIQADLDLLEFPDGARLLPTRLGNILRSAEDRCGVKYGLDAIICWPRLWLVLPEAVKTELSASRNQLNLMARLWLWSLLFAAWGIVFWILWVPELGTWWSPVFRIWWLPLLGILSMGLVYRWLVQVAQVYGELVESAFDLYRWALYEALRWPLPTNPAEERALGQGLTVYLWHGSERDKPAFKEAK